MAAPAINAAARLLADLRMRRAGRDQPLGELPADMRPPDMAAAYQVQSRLADILAPDKGAVCGWKIGCTTPVMQDYLKIDHPCAGRLYERTTHRGNATLRAADYFGLGLECEIAVVLARDLIAGDDPASAVGVVMASVEIVEHRFRDFLATGAPTLTADDFFSAGCVLGEAQPLAKVGDLATLTGGFSVNDADPAATGEGAAIMGHPLTALAWIAEHAAAQSAPLRAGQIVTLGSVVKTIYPEADDVVEARFDGLAPVRIEIV